MTEKKKKKPVSNSTGSSNNKDIERIMSAVNDHKMFIDTIDEKIETIESAIGSLSRTIKPMIERMSHIELKLNKVADRLGL